MKEFTILKKIKMTIASIGFMLFIWGNETTKEKYWNEICDQENNYRSRNDKETSDDWSVSLQKLG